MGTRPRSSVVVTLFLGAHRTADDAAPLASYLTQADLYVPEAPGWNRSHERVLNAVSEGQLTPEQVVDKDHRFAGHAYGELSFLHGSKIPVALVDVPADEAEALRGRFRTFASFVVTMARRPSPLASYPFETILKEGHGCLRYSVDALRERESAIVTNFTRVVPSKTRERVPRRCGPIRVLLRLGTFHTRVGICLQARGFAIERVFARKPVQFDHIAQARRRILFGREVDDTLLVRAMLTKLMYLLGKQDAIERDFEAFSACCREVIDPLTVDEIAWLWRRYWKFGPQRGWNLSR